jgi:transcriptional regulator with XRE-family HTH domain
MDYLINIRMEQAKYFLQDENLKINDLAKKIGMRLKKLRKVSGLTLKQLAHATGLSSPFLSRIENSRVMPSLPTLQAITKSVHIGICLRTKEDRRISTYRGKRKITF